MVPGLPAHRGGCIVYMGATAEQRVCVDMFVYLLGSMRCQRKVRGIHIC